MLSHATNNISFVIVGSLSTKSLEIWEVFTSVTDYRKIAVCFLPSTTNSLESPHFNFLLFGRELACPCSQSIVSSIKLHSLSRSAPGLFCMVVTFCVWLYSHGFLSHLESCLPILTAWETLSQSTQHHPSKSVNIEMKLNERYRIEQKVPTVW